jgi:hypothetical protein
MSKKSRHRVEGNLEQRGYGVDIILRFKFERFFISLDFMLKLVKNKSVSITNYEDRITEWTIA